MFEKLFEPIRIRGMEVKTALCCRQWERKWRQRMET